MPPPIIIQKELDFPAYGIAFNDENVLFIGGGGGANRSGVKNKLVSFKIEENSISKLSNLDLSEKEDCPMSIACHPQLPQLTAGINSSEENIKQENNNNCRIFEITSNEIKLKQQISTSRSKDIAEYQKVTRYSRSGKYLVTAFSDGKVSVLSTADWKYVFPVFQFKDIQDVDFDTKEEHIAIATLKDITIISLQERGSVVQVIDSPRLNRKDTCQIRAVRYATFNGQETLYTIINSTSKGRAFICSWDLPQKRKYPVIKPKTAGIHRKNITCFSVSPKGDLLAFASNDLSVGLLDAQTFKPLLRINQMHGFAITSITFNKSGKYLATAGADNLCKIIKLGSKKNLETKDMFSQAIYVVLDMLLFALLMHVTVQMVDQGN